MSHDQSAGHLGNCYIINKRCPIKSRVRMHSRFFSKAQEARIMANLEAIAVALNSLSRGAISSSSEQETLENFLEDFFYRFFR